MTQQVLLTIRYKKHTEIFQIKKNETLCCSPIDYIGQRGVTFISSMEMVITGRDAYHLKMQS